MKQLSIHIPSLIERKEPRERLISILEAQIKAANLEDEVEILTEIDNRELSIGEKRQRLYERSKGKFSVQIDDDDAISKNYIEEIFLASLMDVDCIGYIESVTMNGRPFYAKHSIKYEEWGEVRIPRDHGDGGFPIKYRRTPFCKTPIRTDLCKKVGLPFIRFGEDHEFSKRIRPLLKREAFINGVMYFYKSQYMTREQMSKRYGQDF